MRGNYYIRFATNRTFDSVFLAGIVLSVCENVVKIGFFVLIIYSVVPVFVLINVCSALSRSLLNIMIAL